MSGEQAIVKQCLNDLDNALQREKKSNAAYAEDLLFMELLTRLAKRRSEKDIMHQVQYHFTYEERNLGADEFVVTRGC